MIPRLILTDLDGTLLANGGVPEENARALRYAAGQGAHIAIASGRVAPVCAHLALQLGLPECHILALNGAHVLSRPGGETLFERLLPREAIETSLDWIARFGYITTLYTHAGIFTTRRFETETDWNAYLTHFPGGCTVESGDDPLAYAARHPILKLIYRPREGDLSPRIDQALADVPGIYLTSSRKNTMEVMPAGAGKLEAAMALAQSLGLSQEEVAAFGDYDNDLPLLRWARLSFAMANGSPEVRHAARFLTDANTEAGVAKGIWRMYGFSQAPI